jgi:hypothetical protein
MSLISGLVSMRRSLIAPALATALVGASVLTQFAAAPMAPAPSPDASFPLVAKPKVYVVPMSGQIGTDVHVSIYKKIAEDIRKAKPDIILFHMDCYDIPKSLMLHDAEELKEERGMPDLDHIRDLVRLLREDLRDIPQAIWVEDAVGVSSIVALAWPNLYMSNKARFGAFSYLISMIKASYSQEDVEAKMVAAYIGGIQGILEKGGYELALGNAIIQPEYVLSAHFEGRQVKFQNDLTGQWLIDNSKDRALYLRATLAEDVGISDGNADSIEDLMFLMGYREFEKIDSGEKMFKDYVEDWRRAMEKVKEYYNEAEELSGRDLKGAQQAKGLFEKALNLVERYPAVQSRLGLDPVVLKIRIDQLQELITAAKKAEREGGGGGSGGRSGGRNRGGNFGSPGR